MKNQYKLLQEVIKNTGINIVTCGDCGDVLLHRLDGAEVVCPHCNFTSDECNFGDLFLKVD